MRPLGRLAVYVLLAAGLLGFASAQLSGANLRIVTIPQPPNVYYDETQIGNARWTGYLIDFWKSLVEQIGQNFTYTFYNSPDGRYGGELNGNWTGMTREILDGNADLALADFTITATRVTSNFWKFLDPFSTGLWLALVAISLGVSVFLWVSDRLSPYGWSKQPRRKDRDNLSYPNSLLASLLLFLGNGNMVLGRSWGTRVLQLAYIGFAVIIVANYTANLAAAYTARRVEFTVQNFNDLAKSKQRFGTMNGTSAQQYVMRWPAQASNMVIYNDQTLLLQDLRNNKLSAYVNDNGLLEYLANQPPCNLFVVGPVFNPATYGIAVPLNGYEPIRQLLSIAALKTLESGVMEALRTRWFSTAACDSSSTTADATKLEAKDLGGAFAVVGIGFGLCLMVIVTEWIFIKCYKRCRSSQAAKEMSDFFGGESDDPIARWRAHSIRGIFQPPPPEIAHRRHIKKHVLHEDDFQPNPLVDLHLASTVQTRNSMNQADDGRRPTAVELASFAAPPQIYAPAQPIAPVPASAAPALIVAIQPSDAIPPVPALPLGSNPDPDPNAKPSNSGPNTSANPTPAVLQVNLPVAAKAQHPVPSATGSGSGSDSGSTVSPSMSPSMSPSSSMSGFSNNASRPLSPQPERRARLMSSPGRAEAASPSASPTTPPVRRQRITGAPLPSAAPKGGPPTL